MTKRVNFEVPEHLMQRVVDALDADGLHVIEYVKSASFRFMISEHPPCSSVRLHVRDDRPPEFISADRE